MPANADDIDLGVIVALRAEAACIGASDGCEVHVAGLGRDRARAGATYLISRGARALASFGVCGGLSSGFAAGDVLLPRRVCCGPDEWRTHDAWRARLLDATPRAREIDAILCSYVPVESPRGKKALAMRGFAAVDMESAGVAKVATDAELPFIVIKAVCDPAARAVPSAALRMLDDDGKFRAAGLFDVLRAGPNAWRELLALRADHAAALSSLRLTAKALPRSARGLSS